MSLAYLPKSFPELNELLIDIYRRLDNIEGLRGDSSVKHSKLADTDDHSNYLKTDGSRKLTGMLDMGGHTIRNGRNPMLNCDVKTGQVIMAPTRQLMLSRAVNSLIDPLSQGFTDPVDVTIASGVITVSSTSKFLNYRVDTEASAATDFLDTINGGYANALLILSSLDATRIPIIRPSATSFLQRNFSLTPHNVLLLICTSTGVWKEISRANNV